jgi:carbon-monoxide dehydrogenase medium subunit
MTNPSYDATVHVRVAVPRVQLLTTAFLRPRSLDEAIDQLGHFGEDARVVGGATALTILLRQRLLRPGALVSLADVPGLDTIACDDNWLRLGALATHRAVERSPVVRQTIPGLARTFQVVANVRVRNVATVGGVVAEADYASDPPAMLVALGAVVDVRGPAGGRSIPADEFFVGFYETALGPAEIVTGVRIPVPAAGTRAVYEKVVTRSSEDRPCLGVAALVRLAPDDRTCQDVRVAVGAVADVPQRFPAVEAMALGEPLDDGLATAVADAYAARIDPIDDLRGSAWYRTEAIRVWVRRALQAARGVT